jgi:hypothetical protein
VLGFAILGEGVWTGHTELDAMSEEERAGGVIVKFAPIVTLNCLDGGAELCLGVGEKLKQC